ncbi:MAG: hypothetical protein LBU53_13695 [Zoogloeaceae bacterium]|jgi:hypothetical protein|nr:hypothetical protein [Zoogloeaceae bacterium]
MTVADRIEEGANCPVIKLSATEKDIHPGAGWKIARFEGGVLVECFDPQNTPPNTDIQAMVREAINDAMFWMSNTDGEHWLALSSGDELREPRKITTSDASAFEKMACVFNETLRQKT